MVKRHSVEEARTIERFKDRYARAGTRAERAVEKAAIGANVGSNGYTTIEQADKIGRLAGLRRGMRLLDIGCGRGYPGLYLARKTGCSVVESDLPLASVRLAVRRAERQRTAGRARFVLSSAVYPPFRPGSFDAIVHTDVMC